MLNVNRELIEQICKVLDEASADNLIAAQVADFLRTNTDLVESVFAKPLPPARVVTAKVIDVSKLTPEDGNHRYLLPRPHQSAVLINAYQHLRADGMLLVVGHWNVAQHEVLENMRIDDELTQPGEPPPATVGQPLPGV